MEMSKQKKSITLFGGVPEPIGGVTNYILRICENFHECIDEVVDFYPSEKKREIDKVRVSVRPINLLVSLFWVRRKLLKKNGVVYFNFSTAKGLALLLFLKKAENATWIVTLHHGELSGGLIVDYISRLILNVRIDRVGYLGSKQKQYYCAMLDKDKLFKIGSHLPTVVSANVDECIIDALMKVKAERSPKKVLLASGYPTKIYRHNWVLDFSRKRLDCLFVFCIYGPDSEGLKKTLVENGSALENVFFFDGLGADVFSQVMKKTDIYVRPNSTDSYGVAVSEALEKGLVAIGSDVCNRADGCILFDADSKIDFFNAMNKAIDEKKPSFSSSQGKVSLQNLKLLSELLK